MKKNTVKIMTLAGILCLASVGGVSAYLTDYEKVSNEFTVGKVDIELKEPEWKPEENKKIEPSKVIHKDPQITNTGTNDAFVYMEVSIPMANVEAAAENGERLGKKVQELFYFEAKDNWMQLSVQNTESRRTYTYAYTKILKPQETSEALFDTVKFLNLIEGQLDGQTFEIPVRAYAIQTSYTGGSSDNLSEQIKAAYEKYVNQNKNQDGKVTE
ncbi:MAG: TasA family protein [Ruminococcus sp.]|nr:TasA family protein [Ruminococcus sp.]